MIPNIGSNDRDLWAVLVAGEHHTVSKSLGSHASLNSIGDAYNALRQYLPRERIIVIAQVDECRLWHELPFESKIGDAEKVDESRLQQKKNMWGDKKAEFYVHLSKMIEVMLVMNGRFHNRICAVTINDKSKTNLMR